MKMPLFHAFASIKYAILYLNTKSLSETQTSFALLLEKYKYKFQVRFEQISELMTREV